MKITHKTKMRELSRIASVIKVSDVDLMAECSKFKLPSKIGGNKVMDFNDFSIGDLLLFWDTKDDNELIELTARCFLGIKKNRVGNLPAIDFLNLVSFAVSEQKRVANLFLSLKRSIKDDRLRSFVEGLPSSDFGIIDRFCKRNGISKRTTNEKSWFDKLTGVKSGEEIPWFVVFSSFLEDVKDYDIEAKRNELSELDNKKSGK